MFKIHELREIIRMIDQSDIQELKLDHEGSRLILRKESKGGGMISAFQAPQIQEHLPVPQVQAVEQPATNEIAPKTTTQLESKVGIADKTLHQIKSPMVGAFYRSPSPDAEPYIKIGDKVNDETVVCIVEAMKLFNEIEAEVDGEIVELLVEDGQLVEYGQPLFLVKVK